MKPEAPLFQGRFLLERGVGVDSWTLAADLTYHSPIAGSIIVVPEGFSTDFASIPSFFHRLLPKNGIYDGAAVVHDFLYATAIVDKTTADLVFLEALKLLGVPAWRRVAMYEAVDKFGGAAWRAHRNGKVPAGQSWKN